MTRGGGRAGSLRQAPRAARPRLAWRLCLLATAAACLAACRYGPDEAFWRPDGVDERVVDDLVPAPAAPAVPDPGNYVFVATADAHFTADGDPPAAAGFRDLVAARGAAFVIVAGDLADTGRPAEFARYAAWAGSLGVPVYAVPGNHDLYNDGWTSYRSWVGRGFYSFSLGGRSFYFLDSGNGTLGRTQLQLLREAFAADSNEKVVTCHYPLTGAGATLYYRLTNKAERAALLDLYASGGVRLLLEGHLHATLQAAVGSIDEWLCSSLTGPAGQGRCVVVTVSGGRIASVTPERY
jgi:3',5'-cyclic-AMP phosphodiesterase